MDPPPVAGDTSATATAEIESPRTVMLNRHSNASKNAGHNVKFGRDRREIQHLLDTVDELQESMDSATIPGASTSLAVPVAMARMKDEFRSILVSISPVQNRLPSDPSSAYTDSESSWQSPEGMNSNSEAIPNEAIHNLWGIAERMISAGKSRECVKVYASARKTSVDDRFEELQGFQRLSCKHIKRLEWQVQQVMIRRWIHTAKICVSGLFAGERTLTEQIFNGLGTNTADDCFIKTVKDSAIKLFNFVEEISNSRKSHEKLFQILDLYKVLSDLLPDIETIFRSKSGEFIRKQAVETLSTLSEAAREILSEFEKAVFGEISKVPISGGSVHSLTTYVMNYISSMAEYKQILTQLIVSTPSTHSSELDFDFSEFEGHASPLMLHLVWIIVVLKFNLQGKSKQYKDTSLAHLFMRNNVDYIVQGIKGSVELRDMIGDDFQNKLISLAEANYHKKTRKRLLDYFRCGGL